MAMYEMTVTGGRCAFAAEESVAAMETTRTRHWRGCWRSGCATSTAKDRAPLGPCCLLD